MDPLIETWTIHQRIHIYLLEAIPNEHYSVPLAKGRSVGDQFRHIHNVRLMWVKSAAPDLLEGLTKLEKGTEEEFAFHLNQSAEAIVEILKRAGDPLGRVKGFKPHACAFVAYLISHESHHRGMIEIALRQAGVPISDKASFGLWEWGSR